MGVENTVGKSGEAFSLHEKGKSQEYMTPIIQPEGVEDEYVFNWKKIPGINDKRLKEFLGKKYNIDWVSTAGISKSEDGKTISISKEDKKLSLTLNDEKSKVILKIDNKETDKFMAKEENGELNIYEDGFSAWIKEITRKEFITTEQYQGIGHAITHAKMIVIDPFDKDCKVITGSHNFSKSASWKNDENFIVIQGNKQLAEAYAVSCLSTYSHYRWRAYLKEMAAAHEKPWSHLSSKDDWQQNYLTDERKRYLGIWCP